jgi:hypothetical protein
MAATRRGRTMGRRARAWVLGVGRGHGGEGVGWDRASSWGRIGWQCQKSYDRGHEQLEEDE